MISTDVEGRLRILHELPAEVVHYYAPGDGEWIMSRGNRFRFRIGGQETEFRPPVGDMWKRPLLSLRMARRAARLDKGNAVLANDRRSALIIYQGRMFRADLQSGELQETGSLRQCRNVLHRAVLPFGQQGFVVAEYGFTEDAAPVAIWRSRDGARSFELAYEFPAGKIRHVHGVYHDPYTGKIWIPTGDFEGQCWMLVTDPDFDDIETLGDGTQTWRAVSLFFTEDTVVWGMDSPLEDVYVWHYDRASGSLERGQHLPGAVWYSKQLTDGVALLQTSRERGPGCKTDHAHIFSSTDLDRWEEVARFKKDRYNPRVFKHGVLAFADGDQTSEDFAFFGEALVGADGRAFAASLTPDRTPTTSTNA